MVTVPSRSGTAAVRPVAAPRAVEAMRLWPQAWPMVGRASYSAIIPCGGLVTRPLKVAVKAVFMPAVAGCLGVFEARR